MKCPACSSDHIIVLVHSLRALCANCMTQWSPTEPLDQILGAPEVAQGLYGNGQPAVGDVPE